MTVHSLEGPYGLVTDNPKMLELATSFYKDLFKKENSSGFSLQDDFFSPKEKITVEQNIGLESPFTE
jgi:hypothetical protein